MAARRPLKAVPSTSDSAPTFNELGVPAGLVTALTAQGITSPFPIQTATLPDSLAGRDLLGRGRTGSGKTYAFALPVLARLAADNRPRRPGRPRALILAPTRELAGQIEATVAPLAKALSLRTMTVYGGVRPGPQVAGLRAGVDVLIACPGRLADHIGSGHARLDAVEITVLDEADHMADLGFLPAVTKLLDQTPRDGQRLLFSATLDAGVDVLVRRFLRDPVTHSVDPPSSPVSAMAHHVLHVQQAARLPVLVDLAAAPGRTLVFTRTKRGATKLTRQLVAEGVPAVELHGNLGQSARTRNLHAFAEGTAATLVATDIAARGIHVDDVALVIHADPPAEHKAYLHRSGRTARAGAAGTVVTLMTSEQRGDVRALTRAAGISPTTTRVGDAGHPLLRDLAPGERSRPGGLQVEVTTASSGGGRSRPKAGAGRSGSGRSGAKPRSTSAQGGGSAKAGSAGSTGGGSSAGGGRNRSRARNGGGSGRSHSASTFSTGRR